MGFIVQFFKEFYSNPVGFYLIVALLSMLAFTVFYFIFMCMISTERAYDFLGRLLRDLLPVVFLFVIFLVLGSFLYYADL
ncbi:hypothetical protein OB986_27245 [Bacillus cereus]|uniref:hypothetical protein n=1 Tax=Bacillus cereus group TaxID=86661 RepID=UPI00032E753E|nr:hypothetical protein [Bacillus cereus]EOO22121.1 hypothetical protein ICC_06526 [Bacillus cereus BAG1X1-1]EOO42443.1 hypothetical protein ICI_06491 [Bacillus cereus BAG1X2-1]EOO43800.1 hypothetical protein ICK_06701 [Bacillus cereus BAG1X2-2]EOP00507.1 hypothetical protein ICO_06209 [Bacillus cereus BAG2O-1]MCU5064899.1 hypothetical protein [Bacillus cereus]